MFIDIATGTRDWKDIYAICLGFVNPRPIALVSTVSANGSHNLAPFSFYNMVCANPPVVMFSTGLKRDGTPKDTFVNVAATREFVVATVTDDFRQQMVDSAALLPYGESEFEFSGLTPAPATRVNPPLVREAKVNIECRLRQTLAIGDGPGSARIVLGDVLCLHVADEILDAERRIDPRKLPTVGRLGGQWYCTVADPYELHIPPPGRRS